MEPLSLIAGFGWGLAVGIALCLIAIGSLLRALDDHDDGGE